MNKMPRWQPHCVPAAKACTVVPASAGRAQPLAAAVPGPGGGVCVGGVLGI